MLDTLFSQMGTLKFPFFPRGTTSDEHVPGGGRLDRFAEPHMRTPHPVLVFNIVLNASAMARVVLPDTRYVWSQINHDAPACATGFPCSGYWKGNGVLGILGS